MMIMTKKMVPQIYVVMQHYIIGMQIYYEEQVKRKNILLKALNIDIRYGHEFKDYDSAELHYKLALDLDSLNKNNKANHDFGKFLIEKRKKYKAGLRYCRKACKLIPKDTIGHCSQGKALYHIETEIELNESKNTLKNEKKDEEKNEIGLSAMDHFSLCADELNQALELHAVNKKLKKNGSKMPKKHSLLCETNSKTAATAATAALPLQAAPKLLMIGKRRQHQHYLATLVTRMDHYCQISQLIAAAMHHVLHQY